MNKNIYMRSEWLNLFRQCKSFGMAYSVFLKFSILTINKIRRKLSRNSVIFYPKNIKSINNQMVLLSFESKNTDVNLSAQNNIESLKRLKLATGFLHYKKTPNWNKSFSDSEQFLSLHRWNWLLRTMTDELKPPSFSWGVMMMRSWLNSQTALPIGLASESYTVGERISNAVLFSRLQEGKWDALPEDISLAIGQMANHLVKNIEYFPEGMSGNHVINNARALIFAGFSINNKEFVELGASLIEERLHTLIYDNGDYREGSSHYNFLFLRWLLEIWFVADGMKDHKIINLVSPFLKPMIEFCHFLLVSNQKGDYTLPTFGDISPDCDPEWIKDLPWSTLAKKFYSSDKPLDRKSQGWSKLFEKIILSSNPLNNSEDGIGDNKLTHKGLKSYPVSGWHKVEWFNWVALWHAEKSFAPAIASHAHHDFGSFILFYKGREVIIDPGRYSYDSEIKSDYGVSANAHSTIKINDMPTMLSNRDRFFPLKYRQSSAVFSCKEELEIIKISLKHNGFLRLGDKSLGHTREFKISKNSVEIVDEFEGTGARNLNIFFQWSAVPKILMHTDYDASKCFDELEGINVLFHIDNAVNIDSKCLIESDKPFGGWRFPAYGVCAPAMTHFISAEINLPAKSSYTIWAT